MTETVPDMDLKQVQRTYIWCLFLTLEVLLLQNVEGQSCGPRVSARLLAEIPCDMSKSSYCSAPGSAYPWSSVKRYINDNQGLVRRMYGDEKHSSILMNEIDGFRIKFDQLRSFMSRGYSRTEYGRSAKVSRRQPRPQIFEEDEQVPSTIFRVVTETSIKVGGPITRPMTTESPTSAYQFVTTDYDSTTAEKTSYATTAATATSTTTDQSTQTDSTDTENDMTHTATTNTPHTSTTSSTEGTTTQTIEDIPVAMERIGYEDIDDYHYESGRKVGSAIHENSVEEKIQHKHDEPVDVKRSEHVDHNEGASIFEVEANSTEEGSAKDTVTKEEEEETEEVPRRGINACPVKNEVIAPYWANNTRGETLALLNVHPFEQYVHFEKCAFENHQMLCREGCRCEQQYRLHRLLAFDPKNECRGIFSDWFRFPSCCVCICYDLTPDIPRTRRRKGRMK